MIERLFLVTLITASLAAVIVGFVTTVTPAFTQNVTTINGNITAANSTTTEERGAYSDYGGGG
jgi:Flp pilus assembly pilin Flp